MGWRAHVRDWVKTVYVLARAGEIQGHVAPCHFVASILDDPRSDSFKDFIGRRTHEPMTSRTLVFDPDKYLHHELCSV